MEECALSLSSLQTPLIIFAISLSARAVFSFLETSITALRLFKLKEIQSTSTQYSALFKTLEKNPQRVLISIVIANCLADVTTAALATQITETIFAHWHLSSGLGFSLGIGVATIAILIFGEIIPKNLARSRSERLFRSTLWLVNILVYLLYPLASVFLTISDYFIEKISGNRVEGESTQWVSSEKEIKFLIDYIKEKGIMETEKTAMLQSIFDLGSTPVKEVMVPVIDMVSMSSTLTTNDTVDIFTKHAFTRFPVYEGEPDNIIGIVHLKDVFALLATAHNKPIKEILRPILFVPESLKINQLLREFRQQHMHLAIVLDEHGSVIGMVTLEDILEEIVGEISDEHRPTAEKIVPLKRGGWLIDASTPLEDVSALLGIEFETEDSITLGGFLTEQLQHLAKKGERVLYENYYFQVQKATEKRILQVLVFKADTAHEMTLD